MNAQLNTANVLTANPNGSVYTLDAVAASYSCNSLHYTKYNNVATYLNGGDWYKYCIF